MTSQEAWKGRKSSFIHLKVFESISYLYVDNQIRNKLDDKKKKIPFWDMIISPKNISFITLIKKI
jgi:hypothetical protein